MLNALSVDIEDWFQVGAFETVIARDDWDDLAHRVEDNSIAVLDLFDRAGVKGTFFTLGWVAHRYPSLIRRIADAGHEVARAEVRMPEGVIRATGEYQVGLQFHSDVSTEVQVNVVAE